MEHTLALIGRAHQGDKAARDTLFKENEGLIYSVARRFLGRGVEMEDLFQIGSIGLLKAIDKFDETYMVKFSTYAVPMIAGEIKRFLRDDGILKVSRSLKENYYHVYQCKEQLEVLYGREPTVTELGELEGKDRTLIYMRYFQELTQSQIADRLGISQVQVSRMEKRILNRLHERWGRK